MTAISEFDAIVAELADLDHYPRRRVVLVPVASFDRRALGALQHASCIPALEHVAVHVVEDHDMADELELSWLTSSVDIPLELLHTDRPVADAITELARDYLHNGADEVVVVLGRQLLRRRWHHLLHDYTSATIGEQLAELGAALPVFVSVAAA